MRTIQRLLCLTVAACLAGSLWAMQTDNNGMHAIPVTSPMVIDGDLQEWDLSGRILICYDVTSLKDIYSGRVAMMYDEDNLYVSLHWKDPKPMGNSHDPKYQANKAWAGDAVQLRIKTDRISHITAWYYAKKQEPAIDITYGVGIEKPFGGGSITLSQVDGWELSHDAAMAFKKDSDGRGYVQEMRIPWELITDKKQYNVGESFRCGIELLWGEHDHPVHRYADNVADGTSNREFFWKAKDAWGLIKLSDRGKLTLPMPPWEAENDETSEEGPIDIHYSLTKSGRVTIAIDDDKGQRIRNLLPAAKRKAGDHIARWDGLDDNGNIVEPGSYIVKGLTHDGLRLTYAHAYASPGNPVWKTSNGKGGYYADHTAPEAVAAGKDRLALACPMGEAGEHLIGVNMKGERQWGLANRASFGGGRISLATDGKILFVANVDYRNNQRFTIWRCYLKDGKYAPWEKKGSNGKPILDLEIMETDGMANCRAIAYHNGRLAVILAKRRQVLLLNADTGDIVKRIESMPKQMTSIAYDSNGTLFLSTLSAVYTVDVDTSALLPTLQELDMVSGLTVAKDGRIFVGQRGTKQCVEIFDRGGKKIGQVGVTGGRPDAGFYNEKGMLNPAQIALDSSGRLWVTESDRTPKRTSVWDSSGNLALDIVGTTAYNEGGFLNPFDHTRAFTERVEYALDYETQTFKPLFTLGDALGTGGVRVCRIAKVNGREYAQIKGASRDSAMVKLYMRKDQGGWQHVAEWGNVGLGKPNDKRNGKWNQKFNSPLWEGHFGKAFLWVDHNSDGKATRDEFQFRPGLRLGNNYWGQAMGENMTVAIPVWGKGIMVFKPQGFLASGVPRYTFSSATHLQHEADQGKTGGMLAVGRDGRMYLNQNPLTAIDANGKQLWTYPNRHVSVHGSHHAKAAAPGYLIGPSSIYGTAYVNKEIGEVFYLNGNLGENYLFTEDGLWVQKIFNDYRGWYDVPERAVPGMPCDAMTAGGESFGGGFSKSNNGKYYTVGGGTGAVVMEITGLDSLKRFASQVEVSSAHIAAAQELKIKRAAKRLAPKVYTVRSVTAPPVDLTAFDMDKHAIQIQSGRNQVAQVKALYDEQYLYLAFNVRDKSPLKNSGQNDKLMFIHGDCVDLMLRTAGHSASRKVQEGDIRLLMTMRDGKPLAVVYRAVVKGTPKHKRVGLSSPWRTVYFDDIHVAEFPLELKQSKQGYIVKADVPLHVLGITRLKGKVLRGDFGVLGSDSAGRECTSRHYWSNKFTNNTSDVPDEALLTPALWGELRFD